MTTIKAEQQILQAIEDHENAKITRASLTEIVKQTLKDHYADSFASGHATALSDEDDGYPDDDDYVDDELIEDEDDDYGIDLEEEDPDDFKKET